MELVVLGINHRSAPVAVRENFSFSEDRIRRAYVHILEELEVSECVILSTCNRTEFYAVVEEFATRAKEQLIDFMQRMGTDPLIPVKEHLFYKTGKDAIAHLFEVSSSLDSLILGRRADIEPGKAGLYGGPRKWGDRNHAQYSFPSRNLYWEAGPYGNSDRS
jgi:glutamyl-tRNA reductase